MNTSEFLIGLALTFFVLMGAIFTIKLSIMAVIRYFKKKILLVKEKRE